jgi:hypothetical protein
MRTLTYYVLDPRDKPCRTINPKLWAEYCRIRGAMEPIDELHTEAYCVQWLDQYMIDVPIQSGEEIA